MSFLSSPALRRVTQLVGTGAAAALVATSLGAGTAAASIESGALDCVVPTADSKTLPTATVQRDPVGPTAAEAAAMESDFEARKAALGFDIDLEDIRDPINIDVYYHVVHKDGTVEGGNIPRTALRAQTKYLNKSFRGHGFGEPGARTPFHFTFTGADRTKNADWYNNAHPPGFAPNSQEIEMKTALREPGSTAETLNVYTANLLKNGLLGYAYFPKSYDDGAIGPIRDGVVLETTSLPGVSTDPDFPYDLGGTLTHEVGHWGGPLPHVPGGLRAARRPGGRHASHGGANLRVPGGQRHLPRTRQRPDPQLHGLQLRRLLQPVHDRAARARD